MALTPLFWSGPLRYWRWCAVEKPALFYSVVIGLMGPAMFVIAPPIRKLAGDKIGRPQIPFTYPIPPGPRKPLDGYDDDTE